MERRREKWGVGRRLCITIMSAARLDPFSARLHAIHRKGAKAALAPVVPKPAVPRPASPLLDADSAVEGVTDMYASLGPSREWSARNLTVDEDAPSYAGMTNPRNRHDGHREFEEADGDVVNDNDDEPPGAGHFGTTQPSSGWGAVVPRQRAQDEDTQDQIRELRRRVEDLENETRSLKAALNRLTHNADPYHGLSAADA